MISKMQHFHVFEKHNIGCDIVATGKDVYKLFCMSLHSTVLLK